MVIASIVIFIVFTALCIYCLLSKPKKAMKSKEVDQIKANQMAEDEEDDFEKIDLKIWKKTHYSNDDCRHIACGK